MRSVSTKLDRQRPAKHSLHDKQMLKIINSTIFSRILARPRPRRPRRLEWAYHGISHPPKTSRRISHVAFISVLSMLSCNWKLAVCQDSHLQLPVQPRPAGCFLAVVPMQYQAGHGSSGIPIRFKPTPHNMRFALQ